MVSVVAGKFVILSDWRVNATSLFLQRSRVVSHLAQQAPTLRTHLVRGSLSTRPDKRFVRRATTATLVQNWRGGNSGVRTLSSRATSTRSLLCSRLKEIKVGVARIGTWCGRCRRWRGRKLVSRRRPIRARRVGHGVAAPPSRLLLPHKGAVRSQELRKRDLGDSCRTEGGPRRSRANAPRGAMRPCTARAGGAAKKQLRRCQAQHNFCPYGAVEVECPALIDRAAGEEQVQPQRWGQAALSLCGRQIESGCPRIV